MDRKTEIVCDRNTSHCFHHSLERVRAVLSQTIHFRYADTRLFRLGWGLITVIIVIISDLLQDPKSKTFRFRLFFSFPFFLYKTLPFIKLLTCGYLRDYAVICMAELNFMYYGMDSCCGFLETGINI